MLVGFDRLNNSGTPPTVIICGNDVLGVGALRRAQDRGMSIPKDISITGFDDIGISRIVTPALTTVHVPHSEMGTKAADKLVAMVHKTDKPGSIRLPTTLKLRASLAPPHDRNR